MSKKRQKAVFNPQGHPSAQVTTLSFEFKNGYVVPDHFHKVDQLVFASQGVMTVRTDSGIWVVPPLRAVWIPANVVHAISMSGIVSMRTLYFVAKSIGSLPRNCVVLNVSPLLKELILHSCQSDTLSRKIPRERHLIESIVDQLEIARSLPLQLPHPSDSRAMRIVETLLSDPSDQKSLTELCKNCGASKRTVERLFIEETKLTFGKWRQQLRLLHAMKLLASGETITGIALEAGYSTPSAFISMFRKALGTTPTRYFEKHETTFYRIS